jgi:hypothetical protein
MSTWMLHLHFDGQLENWRDKMKTAALILVLACTALSGCIVTPVAPAYRVRVVEAAPVVVAPVHVWVR